MSNPAIRLTTTLIFTIMHVPILWLVSVSEGWGRWFAIVAVSLWIGNLLTKIGAIVEAARNRSPY